MTAPNKPKPTAIGAMLAVAACSLALTGGSEIQLLPAGEFKAIDGRPALLDGKPTGIPAWRTDESRATALVAVVNSRVNPYVIDYDHQTLLARENGKPAPAAGWFTKVEWRPGAGLFAVDVNWTEAASAMIDAGEYRFISPVLVYDQTGTVTGLLMAAITNYPAIQGMDEIMLAAATQQYAALSALTTQPQESHMDLDALLEQLRWMLNLPLAATAEEVLAQLAKLADIIKQGKDVTAAASCDLGAMITSMRTEIAALSAAVPDPAKYVPVDVVTTLHQQIASLSAQANTKGLDDTIRTAMASGKLLPAQESWARGLGATNMAALTAYIANAPAVAALNGMQTSLTPPPITGPGTAALTADQKSLCQAFGMKEEEFLDTLRKQGLV